MKATTKPNLRLKEAQVKIPFILVTLEGKVSRDRCHRLIHRLFINQKSRFEMIELSVSTC